MTLKTMSRSMSSRRLLSSYLQMVNLRGLHELCCCQCTTLQFASAISTSIVDRVRNTTHTRGPCGYSLPLLLAHRAQCRCHAVGCQLFRAERHGWCTRGFRRRRSAAIIGGVAAVIGVIIAVLIALRIRC